MHGRVLLVLLLHLRDQLVFQIDFVVCDLEELVLAVLQDVRNLP